MSEPRRWTIDICEACGVQRMIRGPYCPCGAGMEECEVIEAAPVEARIAELEGLLETVKDGLCGAEDLLDEREVELERLRKVEAAAITTFDACGNGDDALGDALVNLGLALAGEDLNVEPSDA